MLSGSRQLRILNTLSAALTLLRVSNLAGKDFQASTFLIAELVDMAGFDDFSQISVSIHCFAVDLIKITTAGLIQPDLRRKNRVFYAGYGLFILPVFHKIVPLSAKSVLCIQHQFFIIITGI